MKIAFELTEDQASILLAHARNEGIKAQEYLDRMTAFCSQYKSGVIPKPVKMKIENNQTIRDMWVEIYLKLEEHHEHL